MESETDFRATRQKQQCRAMSSSPPSAESLNSKPVPSASSGQALSKAEGFEIVNSRADAAVRLAGGPKFYTRWPVSIPATILLIAAMGLKPSCVMRKESPLRGSPEAYCETGNTHHAVHKVPEEPAHALPKPEKLQSDPAQGQLLLSEPPDYSFLYNANIPPAEKKILWQKMKKLRSAG